MKLSDWLIKDRNRKCCLHVRSYSNKNNTWQKVHDRNTEIAVSRLSSLSQLTFHNLKRYQGWLKSSEPSTVSFNCEVLQFFIFIISFRLNTLLPTMLGGFYHPKILHSWRAVIIWGQTWKLESLSWTLSHLSLHYRSGSEPQSINQPSYHFVLTSQMCLIMDDHTGKAFPCSTLEIFEFQCISKD